MSELLYYRDGDEIKGPLEMGSILAAAKAGRLSTECPLSPDKVRWAPMHEVEKMGVHWVFQSHDSRIEKPAAPSNAMTQASKSKDELVPSVSGIVDVFGWVSGLAGVVCVFLGLFGGMDSPPFWIATGMGGVFWGVMLFAASEVLKRLFEIEKNLKEKR